MIILGILKIIGIVLLVILGITLVLLCLILFVPVRYKAEAQAHDGDLRAEVKVSWLFRAVSFRFLYDHKGNPVKSGSLKIFGIPFEKIKAFFRKKKTRKKDPAKVKKKLKKLKKKDPEKYERLKAEAKARREAEKERLRAEETKAREEEEAERKKDQELRRMLRQRKARVARDIPARINLLIRGLGRLFRKIGRKLKKAAYICLTAPQNVISRLSHFVLRVRETCAKIKKWKDFLWDERLRTALRLVLSKSRKLIRHIRPRKLEGRVVFGMEDPYQTGLILAAVEPFHPVWGKAFAVEADFENKTLDGYVKAKGRIFVFYAAAVILKVISDKNVKYVISFIRSVKEEKKNVGK